MKEIKVEYTYVPDSQAEQKVTDVFNMLFEEIKEIIALEQANKIGKK